MKALTGLKFKVPRKGDYHGCHVTADHVTNGHWLFESRWLERNKGKTRALRNMLKNLRVEKVTARLQGEEVRDFAQRIGEIIPDADRIAERYEAFESGHPKAFQTVEKPKEPGALKHVLLSDADGTVRTAVGYQYAACFLFSPDVEIFVNKTDRLAPVVLMECGHVVGLIMPIRVAELENK